MLIQTQNTARTANTFHSWLISKQALQISIELMLLEQLFNFQGPISVKKITNFHVTLI